jgi:hypothetical protein
MRGRGKREVEVEKRERERERRREIDRRRVFFSPSLFLLKIDAIADAPARRRPSSARRRPSYEWM